MQVDGGRKDVEITEGVHYLEIVDNYGYLRVKFNSKNEQKEEIVTYKQNITIMCGT